MGWEAPKATWRPGRPEDVSGMQHTSGGSHADSISQCHVFVLGALPLGGETGQGRPEYKKPTAHLPQAGALPRDAITQPGCNEGGVCVVVILPNCKRLAQCAL